MPNYKIVDADKLDSDLTVVANAIREKAGRIDNLAFPFGMSGAVREIGRIDEYHTIEMGDTVVLSPLAEDFPYGGDPITSTIDKGDNPDIIQVTKTEPVGTYLIRGLSEGTTIVTMSYEYTGEEYDDMGDARDVRKKRTLRYAITVTGVSVSGHYTISVGESVEIGGLAEDLVWDTPIFSEDSFDCGDNPDIIEASVSDNYEAIILTGLSEGVTEFTLRYGVCDQDGNPFVRTVKYTIIVTEASGGGSDDIFLHTGENTINLKVGETKLYCTDGKGDNISISIFDFGDDSVALTNIGVVGDWNQRVSIIIEGRSVGETVANIVYEATVYNPDLEDYEIWNFEYNLHINVTE